MMNGSFIDDIGLAEGGHTILDGNGGFMFENAEEKLRQLAIQLGEACLTNDLAALISQKRDIELVKSARKSVHSGIGSRTTKAANSKYAQRSISVSYNYEPFFNRAETKYDMQSRIETEESMIAQNSMQIVQTIAMKTRLAILNLAYSLLKQYDS